MNVQLVNLFTLSTSHRLHCSLYLLWSNDDGESDVNDSLESSFSPLPSNTHTSPPCHGRLPVKSHGVIGGDMKRSKCH